MQYDFPQSWHSTQQWKFLVAINWFTQAVFASCVSQSMQRLGGQRHCISGAIAGQASKFRTAPHVRDEQPTLSQGLSKEGRHDWANSAIPIGVFTAIPRM